jgi:hypothetical protein
MCYAKRIARILSILYFGIGSENHFPPKKSLPQLGQCSLSWYALRLKWFSGISLKQEAQHITAPKLDGWICSSFEGLSFKLSIVFLIKFRGVNQPPRLAAKR